MHKAIVEEVIDKYNIRVRIPFYDKAAESASATKFEDLSIACICTPAGESPALIKGDIVFVDFEDNNLGKPVIIGTLFRESGVKSKTNISANSLEVLVDSNIEGVVKSVNGMTGDVIVQPGNGGGSLPDNLVYHDEELVPEDIPPVVDSTARSQIQQIVPVENTTTALRAYSIGDYFVDASGILVKATAVIAVDDTIDSTNSAAVNATLADEIANYSYKPGDIIDLTNIICSGYISNSSKNIVFFIPFNKPCIATSCTYDTTTTKAGIRHADGGYILANNTAISTLGLSSSVFNLCSTGVFVKHILTTASTFTNNSLISIHYYSGTLIFS